ncbi:MAG: ribbon-helix-helix protein, CopG family [Thermoanaerobaculia bacterium]
MARLTITLPDELHQALKEAAARRRRTIGELVCESLTFYGIKGDRQVSALVEAARRHAGSTPSEAEELAVRETRAHRR